MTTIQSIQNSPKPQAMDHPDNNNNRDKDNEGIQNIFRYKFDNHISDMMCEFARIHRLDSRNDFKENFEEWFVANNEIIEREKVRLDVIGCSDNIHTKLFRSIKYYYAKKKNAPSKTKTGTEKKRPDKYIQHTKEFKDNVATFIKDRCFIECGQSPKKGYELFLVDSDACAWIDKERARLQESCGISTEDAVIKIKKTFKNSYFQINKPPIVVQEKNSDKR